MEPTVVRVNNLSKKFKIYTSPWDRALEWVRFGRKRYHQEFWALRRLSFEVSRGECLGIIGPNGAGKTTLLKILTRALHPTSGTFEIGGRVLSLLELGTGFNPELTGRQNLYNSAHLLGLADYYLEARISDIEAFAGLGDFFDRPLKLYSSGMYVRLAFSLFAFLRPEVLIIDEALSVGDVFFQQKSFAKMREILSGGTTCLFVSHDTAAVQNLCRRAILLRHGEIAFAGDAREAVSRYFASLGLRPDPRPQGSVNRTIAEDLMAAQADREEILAHTILNSGANRHGAGGLEVVAARVTDREGRDSMQSEMGERLTFHLLLRANQDIVDPSAGLHLFDRLGNLVFAAGTRQQSRRLPDLSAGDELVVSLELQLAVQPGEYVFSLGASEPSSGQGPHVGYIHDRHELLGPIVVTADPTRPLPFFGIAQLPMKVGYWRVQPEGSRPSS
jgi:lipopolysaccharide transport system ATP-binding protein